MNESERTIIWGMGKSGLKDREETKRKKNELDGVGNGGGRKAKWENRGKKSEKWSSIGWVFFSHCSYVGDGERMIGKING